MAKQVFLPENRAILVTLELDLASPGAVADLVASSREPTEADAAILEQCDPAVIVEGCLDRIFDARQPYERTKLLVVLTYALSRQEEPLPVAVAMKLLGHEPLHANFLDETLLCSTIAVECMKRNRLELSAEQIEELAAVEFLDDRKRSLLCRVSSPLTNSANNGDPTQLPDAAMLRQRIGEAFRLQGLADGADAHSVLSVEPIVESKDTLTVHVQVQADADPGRVVVLLARQANWGVVDFVDVSSLNEESLAKVLD